MPAVVLVHNYHASKPNAIDFTINYSALRLRQAGTHWTLLLRKRKASAPLSALRQLIPFACNTYGALHPTARHVVSRVVIQRLVEGQADSDCCNPAALATRVWRGITASIVSRACIQLARHTEADSPAGLPLQMLSRGGDPATLSAEPAEFVTLPSVWGTLSSSKPDPAVVERSGSCCLLRLLPNFQISPIPKQGKVS